MRALILLVSAVILGLTGGYGWSKWSNASPAAVANAPKGPCAKPDETAAQIEDSDY